MWKLDVHRGRDNIPPPPPLKIKCVVQGAVDKHCKIIVTPRNIPFIPFRQLVEDKIGSEVERMYYTDDEGDTVDTDDDAALRTYLDAAAGSHPPKLTLVLRGRKAAQQAKTPGLDEAHPETWRKIYSTIVSSSSFSQLPPDVIQALEVLSNKMPSDVMVQFLQLASQHADPLTREHTTPEKRGSSISPTTPTMPPLLSPSPEKKSPQRAVFHPDMSPPNLTAMEGLHR
eukprot:Sspe_Gene.92666::Locus_65379_Transcript_1_1_Confidence_1.000_Length_1325::g.92666::m.92666